MDEGSAGSEGAREAVASYSEELPSTSRSRSLALAILPVSTFIDDTDMAPGVRGSGARRLENCWLSRVEVVDSTEVVGVSLSEGS